MEIVLATRNRDKIKEITAMLADVDVTIRDIDEFDNVPEVVEDRDTLEGNALKKAREVRDATGISALADDTGLFVEALDGAPGVYSSRYAGENVTYADNVKKLLEEMTAVASADREAEFRTIMALALVDDVADALYKNNAIEVEGDADRPDALVGEGILPGRITETARGEHGFGYDPIFETQNKTLAEMTLEEKNETSHRYRALLELRELMLRVGVVKERG